MLRVTTGVGTMALVVSALTSLALATPSLAATSSPTPDPATAVSPPAGAQEVGNVPSSQQVTGEVALAPADQSALNAFVSAVSTPGSPEYRHFLGPGQFGPLFGATSSTIAAVRSWLSGTGLQVSSVDPDDLYVHFSGTASKVESALRLSMHRYRYDSRTGYSAVGTPSVPDDLEKDIKAIVGLSNLVAADDHLDSPQASASVGGAPASPLATGTCETEDGDYTASDLAQAYGLSSLNDNGLLGSGVTVALFELEPFSTQDISDYMADCGGHNMPTVVPVDGGPGSPPSGACSEWAEYGCGEAALDIEMIMGLAPDANIDVYEGPPTSQQTVLDVYTAIANDDSAQIVSTSWGLCEPALGWSTASAQEAVFEQMAAQGQSVLAASGDNGSSDCYGNTGLPADEQDEAAVDDPSSQPDVTGVGGTTLSNPTTSPSEVVWNTADGAGGGGQSSFSPDWTAGSYGWQEPASGSADREVPDVAASAGYPDGADSIVWDDEWTPVGGTSAAVVTWAGLLADVDQGCAPSGDRMGELNPTLYRLEGSAALKPVTSGDNDYLSIQPDDEYEAGGAYSMAAGLGSPDAGGLLSALDGQGDCGASAGGIAFSSSSGSSAGLPTVAVPGPGNTVDVYWEAANAQWYGPYGVGQGFGTASIAVSPTSGLPTIAVDGPDNSVYVYWEAANAQWYGPLGVGAYGTAFSPPSISIGGTGLPTVAVEGPDHELYVYWEASNAQWYGPLGAGKAGSTYGAPSVSVNPQGLPTVAVEGPSDSTYVYWEAANAQWYGPLGVGPYGSTYGPPSISVSPSGLPTVAVEGPRNSTYIYWEASNAQWYGPLGVGTYGSTFSAPSISVSPQGLPTVAVQGPGNSVWIYWEAANAQWYGPFGAGQGLGPPDIAVSRSTGLPTVAVEGPGGDLYVYWEASNAQWYGPLGVGGPGSTSGTPSVAVT